MIRAFDQPNSGLSPQVVFSSTGSRVTIRGDHHLTSGVAKMWWTAIFDRCVHTSVDHSLRCYLQVGGNRWCTFILLGILAFGACTTDRSPAPSVTRLPHGMCTTERPLGSHRPTRVCRSNAQIEADRKQAQETLNQVRKTPGGAASTQ